jgi:cytochrome c oxidase subunit 2
MARFAAGRNRCDSRGREDRPRGYLVPRIAGLLEVPPCGRPERRRLRLRFSHQETPTAKVRAAPDTFPPAARLGLAAATLLAACTGEQSALDPAGRGAERLAGFFWWMAAAAIVIWLAVVGLLLYATILARKPHGVRTARVLIVGGGVVFPTVVLAVLLTYALAILPGLLEPVPDGALRVHVVGEQWWWRVRYRPDSGPPVDLANEIRLPVGTPVELRLGSRDVIHSLWIPALGGKVDMIPGRETRLRLEPTKTGVFRGVCAEYCGTSHALMAFAVVVQERAEFDQWLARQAEPAASPAGPAAMRGRELFLANGCGACHAVRGTRADGLVGPDLTHVGGRLSIGAGVLSSTPADFHRWLAYTDSLKPSVHMPRFGMLPDEELAALAEYLTSLR